MRIIERKLKLDEKKNYFFASLQIFNFTFIVHVFSISSFILLTTIIATTFIIIIMINYDKKIIIYLFYDILAHDLHF